VASVAVFGLVLEAAGIGLFPVLVVGCFGALWLAARRLGVDGEPPAERKAGVSVRAVLRQPAVAWFFAGVSLTVLAHTALYAFLSLYLDELGYGKGAVGALWAAGVAVEVLFFWTQGRWFGRLTPHRWLELAAALAVLRFALTAAAGPWLLVLVAAQLLHAVTFAAQHAACIALIQRHFPGPLRGRGQALYSVLGYGLSGVVGGLTGGWLGSRFGFASVFWAAAGVALLAWAVLRHAARLDRRSAPPT